MKKKISLSVCIPAYNEAANIKTLLESILKQKQDNFLLETITVYTDCGTDNTPEIVEQFAKQHPIVKLIKGKERKGKYLRVNQIFRECATDAVVILDADIALVGEHFLDKLSAVLIEDPKALLVAALQKQIRPKGFLPRIIYAHFVLWDYVRASLPDKQNGQNYFGSATAYRGAFARSIKIPEDLSDPHLFIYLSAAKEKGFRYCESAEILQWPITTMADLRKFFHRSIGKKDAQLERMFGTTAAEVYKTPLRYKLIGFLRALAADPFYTFLSLGLHVFALRETHVQKTDQTAIWDVVMSTKKSTAQSEKKLS